MIVTTLVEGAAAAGDRARCPRSTRCSPPWRYERRLAAGAAPPQLAATAAAGAATSRLIASEVRAAAAQRQAAVHRRIRPRSGRQGRAGGADGRDDRGRRLARDDASTRSRRRCTRWPDLRRPGRQGDDDVHRHHPPRPLVAVSGASSCRSCSTRASARRTSSGSRTRS